MSGLPEDDDELIAELRRSIAGEARPQITEILKQIPNVVSPLDAKGDIVSDTTAELSGARDATSSRQLVIAFDQDLLTFEIDDGGVVTGQVPESWQDSTVEVDTLQGSQSIEVDEFGLFRHGLAATGPFRITAASSDGVVATDWLLR